MILAAAAQNINAVYHVPYQTKGTEWFNTRNVDSNYVLIIDRYLTMAELTTKWDIRMLQQGATGS